MSTLELCINPHLNDSNNNTAYACITGVNMTIIIVVHKLINKFNTMNA